MLSIAVRMVWMAQFSKAAIDRGSFQQPVRARPRTVEFMRALDSRATFGARQAQLRTLAAIMFDRLRQGGKTRTLRA
jgi:hypothetical protein